MSEVFRGLTPDGLLPTAAQAQVQAMISAKVDPLAAITIVGAGRPDQPATLTTPGTADLVAAAGNGTEFRSLDGAGVGAKKWMKYAGAWVETDADTGWCVVAAWDAAGTVLVGSVPHNGTPTPGSPGYIHIRRVNRRVYYRVRSLTAGGQVWWTSPPGFQGEPSTALAWVISSGSGAVKPIVIATTTVTFGNQHAPTDRNSEFEHFTPRAWPSSIPVAV